MPYFNAFIVGLLLLILIIFNGIQPKFVGTRSGAESDVPELRFV